MATNLDVIIPVFNAFEEAGNCLASVLTHSAGIHRVFVIDDASTQGSFETHCRYKGISSKLVTWIRVPTNKGFVASCNLGIREAKESDVILLNSDTLVTSGWAEKMQTASLSQSNVGTVTPFTNNGTIASIPYLTRENIIPENLTLDAFAQIVEGVSSRAYPTIPTCIGFCVLIRRELLNTVGLLDEEAFPRGYGEENDLSLRGQKAGFTDILDDATFVYHKGSSSFGAEKVSRSKVNAATVNRRYPHYERAVTAFYRNDPLAGLRNRVSTALEARRFELKLPRVLHILHNGPIRDVTGVRGGTERHVEMLTREIKGSFHWSLVPHPRAFVLSSHGPGWSREYYVKRTTENLRGILNAFEIVHLHHAAGFDYALLVDHLTAHPSVVVSVHDFNAITPRFHLSAPPGSAADRFEHASEFTGMPDDVRSRLAASQRLFRHAKKVIFFSSSSKRIVEAAFRSLHKDTQEGQPLVNALITAHPAPQGAPRPAAPSIHDQPSSALTEVGTSPVLSGPLDVCFLGTLAPHKGEQLATELCRRETLPSGRKVRWHLLGGRTGPRIANLTEHGTYEREDVVGKLRAIAPQVTLFLSSCPETYGLTVDESVAAGIPLIVTPYGAPAERVREWKVGLVLKELSVDAVLLALDRFAEDLPLQKALVEATARCALPTAKGAAHVYAELYREVLGKFSSAALDRALAQLLLSASSTLPEPSLKRKVAQFAAETVTSGLDHLRIRQPLQQWFKAHAPTAIYDKLRSVRRGS